MGNCCSTKIENKVNSDNINNGIYARNTGGSQIHQNFPRFTGRYGGKKSCPFCYEPIGENFIAKKMYDTCAKCNIKINDTFGFKCMKCGGCFHSICVN